MAAISKPCTKANPVPTQYLVPRQYPVPGQISLLVTGDRKNSVSFHLANMRYERKLEK